MLTSLLPLYKAAPLVGLQFVVEVLAGSAPPTYYCFLCKAELTLKELMFHLLSAEHRLSYLVSGCIKRQVFKDRRQPSFFLLRHVCRHSYAKPISARDKNVNFRLWIVKPIIGCDSSLWIFISEHSTPSKMFSFGAEITGHNLVARYEKDNVIAFLQMEFSSR